MLANLIQNKLQSLYGFQCALDVRDFIIHEDILSKMHLSQKELLRESLLVLQESD